MLYNTKRQPRRQKHPPYHPLNGLACVFPLHSSLRQVLWPSTWNGSNPYFSSSWIVLVLVFLLLCRYYILGAPLSRNRRRSRRPPACRCRPQLSSSPYPRHSSCQELARPCPAALLHNNNINSLLSGTQGLSLWFDQISQTFHTWYLGLCSRAQSLSTPFINLQASTGCLSLLQAPLASLSTIYMR